LLIPGTRSITHLEENLGAGDVTLDAEAIARLDAVTEPGSSAMPDGIEGFLEQD
jgi:pyridoxine 4-dehydrogenase